MGQLHRDIDSAADAGMTEKILGVSAKIGDETVERIVLRINGPDDSAGKSLEQILQDQFAFALLRVP